METEKKETKEFEEIFLNYENATAKNQEEEVSEEEEKGEQCDLEGGCLSCGS